MHARVGPARRLVGHDGIDFGVFDQGDDVIHVEVGRTQQHVASHAIDLGHREAADQLIRYREQHRTPGELAGATYQASMLKDIRQLHNLPRIRQCAALQLRAEIIAEREVLTRGHLRRSGRNRRPLAETPHLPRW
jgi:hypothetical protein